MRFMGWSWRDYCELPSGHFDALIELIGEERRRLEQEDRRRRMR